MREVVNVHVTGLSLLAGVVAHHTIEVEYELEIAHLERGILESMHSVLHGEGWGDRPLFNRVAHDFDLEPGMAAVVDSADGGWEGGLGQYDTGWEHVVNALPSRCSVEIDVSVSISVKRIAMGERDRVRVLPDHGPHFLVGGR